MALELWNELEVSEAESTFVEVEGEGVSETPRTRPISVCRPLP